MINRPTTTREPNKKESTASNIQVMCTDVIDDTSTQSSVNQFKDNNAEDNVINVEEDDITSDATSVSVGCKCEGSAQSVTFDVA